MRNTLLMVLDGLLLIKSRSQLHPPRRFDLAPADAHNTNGTGSRPEEGVSQRISETSAANTRRHDAEGRPWDPSPTLRVLGCSVGQEPGSAGACSKDGGDAMPLGWGAAPAWPHPTKHFNACRDGAEPLGGQTKPCVVAPGLQRCTWARGPALSHGGSAQPRACQAVQSTPPPQTIRNPCC